MLYYYCYVRNYRRSTFDLQSSTVPAGNVIDDDNLSIVHDDNTSMLLLHTIMLHVCMHVLT